MRIPAGSGVTIYPAIGLFYAHTSIGRVWGDRYSVTEPLVTGQIGLRVGKQVVIEPAFGLLDDEWQASVAVRVLITAGGKSTGDDAGGEESEEDDRNPW